MKFIKVNFNGGLGNQLFQYATARGICDNGYLLFNTTNYKNDYLNRQFGLIHFRVKGKIITDNEYALKLFTPNTKFNQLVSKLGLFASVNEKGFFIHEGKALKTKFLNSITGFWQSEVYFKHISKELLHEIVPTNLPSLPSIIASEANTVAVHVRRTDYLKDDRYGFLGETYYVQAIELCKAKVSDPIFIFFSDDMDWCKRTFENQEGVVFFEDAAWDKDYLQLYLMAQCKHQVIANSSFSWWSGWLNKNENKLVVRPLNPFKDASLLYESYYPEEWIGI